MTEGLTTQIQDLQTRLKVAEDAAAVAKQAKVGRPRPIFPMSVLIRPCSIRIHFAKIYNGSLNSWLQHGTTWLADYRAMQS